MKLKLKHLRHPVSALSAARAAASERRSMLALGRRGESRYAGDPRFDPQAVTTGFASRPSGLNLPAAALERICAAYRAAADQELIQPAVYGASPWWEKIRESSLGPVLTALRDRDLLALRGMYRNFFRDPCSTGLIGGPYGVARPYENPQDPFRRLYLVDSLYRLDHWTSETAGRFSIRDLAGAGIGNPFGLLQDGTLIESGAEYRHYCAQRIAALLGTESAVVAEIGGGFGGMAYYLLRDRPETSYVDFDVPESLALTAYFLMSALPQLTFRLYGEPAQGRADVTLLPPFDLAAARKAGFDMVFSSHTLAQLLPSARAEYWKHMARVARAGVLYIGAGEGRAPLPALETRPSGWDDHKLTGLREVECVYRPPV